MAKIRALKPETWTDEKFVSLSPMARLLFLGMWNHACDNGHIENRPIQLKVRILPMDDADISALVSELVALGMVEDQGDYLKVVRLAHHQKLDRRYLAFCDQCDHDEHVTYTRRDRIGRTTGTQRMHDGHSSLPQRSHDGHPTGTRRAPVADGDGDGDGDNQLALVPSANASQSRSQSRIEDDFADWYQRYPRKRDKGHALKAYRAARKKTDHATLVAALDNQREAMLSAPADKRPYPATWLNGERWLDEPDPVSEKPESVKYATEEEYRQAHGHMPRPPWVEDDDEWIDNYGGPIRGCEICNVPARNAS